MQVKTLLISFGIAEIRFKQKYMALKFFILGKTAFSDKATMLETGQLCISAKIIPFVYY